MDMEVMKERYELSMARIKAFQTEETVGEPYRDYFCHVSRFIGLCGQIWTRFWTGALRDGIRKN